jgi:ferritin-like metal-binding protein YciE
MSLARRERLSFGETMPTTSKEKTLTDAFYETLKDVYFAEKQSVRALTKSTKAAKAPELKQAFEMHREESTHHVERLEQVFEIIGKPARAKTCEAMQGIVHEMQEDLEDFGGTEAADAVLIGCGQAIEHYEMARYGMLKAWAEQLGMDDAAKLLEETLLEEKAADLKLTEIAEASVNAAAGEGESADDEAKDTKEDQEASKNLAKPEGGKGSPKRGA